MKKILIAGLFILMTLSFAYGVSHAVSIEDMDSQGVSLKAGATDLSEGMSIAWIEAALYPKNVEKGKELFVEVKLTSKVNNVYAQFDFDPNSEKVALYSDDGVSWSRVYKAPEHVQGGVHVAKIVIEGKNDKSVTRTLDFSIVEDAARLASTQTYPVSVIKAAPVIENGETITQLLPGVKVTALYKSTFYRIALADGKEGWIEASKIKEPQEELYLRGYKAFMERNYSEAEKNYKEALSIDPTYQKAMYWLAKTDLKLGKNDDASKNLQLVLLQNQKYDGATELLSMLNNEKEKKAAAVVAVVHRPVRERQIVASRDFTKSSVTLVQSSKTNKGTTVASAVKSVMALTKSLGTKIYEDGWNISNDGKNFMVRYACRQERNGKVQAENFDWKIDPDTHSITPISDNSRLLMNRW